MSVVITRKRGEGVVCGNFNHPLGVIRILSIKGHRVRLHLDFLREIPINREEVCDAIRKETEGGVFAVGVSSTPVVIIRREGDAVVCGDFNHPLGVIRILSIKGHRVRVQWDSSREIPIHREEVCGAIRNGTEGGAFAAELSIMDDISVGVSESVPCSAQDEVLDQLNKNWTSLPEHIKLAIQALVDTA